MKYSILALAIIGFHSVEAATIQVTANAVDNLPNGNCSLYEAFLAANTDQTVDECTSGAGADIINVPVGRYTFQSHTEGTALPTVIAGSKIRVVGQGKVSDDTIIQRGDVGEDVPFRLMHVGISDDGQTVGKLTIENVHIRGGLSDRGGAVFSEGVLNVIDSTFSYNGAIAPEGVDDDQLELGEGGAIFSIGYHAILRTTFIQNYATRNTAAIYAIPWLSGLVAAPSNHGDVVNNTFSYNYTLADDDESNTIRTDTSGVRFNTFVGHQLKYFGRGYASNSAPSNNFGQGNLFAGGVFTVNCDTNGEPWYQVPKVVNERNLSTGFCIQGDHQRSIYFQDIHFGEFDYHGGKSKSYAIGFNSPAIGERSPLSTRAARCSGDPTNYRANAVTTDQRGSTRDANCDYGSYEWDSSDERQLTRRHVSGLREPRIAFFDVDGFAFNLDIFQRWPYQFIADVVYLDQVEIMTEQGSFLVCDGIKTGRLGWRSDNGDYAIYHADNEEDNFPNYQCPIWINTHYQEYQQ